MDTMYPDTYHNTTKYNQIISSINKQEDTELPSLLEQCQGQVSSVKSDIQSQWSSRINESIDAIASDNPYLPNVVPGEEISALDAVAWVQGSRGMVTRP